MSIETFLKNYREIIDRIILDACRPVRSMHDNGNLNDKERRMWILNFEPLYNIARMRGVKV